MFGRVRSDCRATTRGRLTRIALAGALAAATMAQAQEHRFELQGHLADAGTGRSVSLRVLCEPDGHGGAMSLELWVPLAGEPKDFDYDDFEGPDAPAGDRPLSRVTFSGPNGAREIAGPAAGWYSGEQPDTFVFGVSQRSHQTGKLASLLGAVDPRHTQLAWVQTSLTDHTHQLRAVFALDRDIVKQIRDTVASCLAPAAHAKSAARH